MSETTTEYGTPKTVCDTRSYPPQIGDLLGSYIARLSALVNALEERVESLIAQPAPTVTDSPLCICGHPRQNHDRYGCAPIVCDCLEYTPAEPEPTAEPVCATCGHAEAYHLTDTDGKPMCRAGTLGKPCMCTEYEAAPTD